MCGEGVKANTSAMLYEGVAGLPTFCFRAIGASGPHVRSHNNTLWALDYGCGKVSSQNFDVPETPEGIGFPNLRETQRTSPQKRTDAQHPCHLAFAGALMSSLRVMGVGMIHTRIVHVVVGCDVSTHKTHTQCHTQLLQSRLQLCNINWMRKWRGIDAASNLLCERRTLPQT